YLELNQVIDRNVGDLSGGELQRFAIAVVAIQNAEIFMFDEPSSYLDVKQRLKAAQVIRSLLRPNSYVIVVEHDLSVLDYLSDFICCLYRKPGAYGVVTLPFSVREGINIFLEGYVPTENLRFRDESLTFKVAETPQESAEEIETYARYKYPTMSKTQGGFKLKVVEGEFTDFQIIVMLGENGTGKTTFIRMLAGILKPDTIEGSETEIPEFNVSYKPQKISPKFPNSVRRLLHQKIRDSYMHPQFVSDVMKPLQIEQLMDQEVVNILSGGELQRVALCLCLGKPADIYLIDEPSAYLDSEQRIVASKVIKRFILHAKKTAFVVEHDFIMATYLADRVIVYEGTLGGGMEPAAGKRKGRKRKRKDGEDVDKPEKTARKTVLAIRSVVLIERYVKKTFECGEFLGKIISYDTGLYRVVYEDGDFEDLETHEAKALLVGDDEMDVAFRKRKKSLDQYVLKKYGKNESVRRDAISKKVENVGNDYAVESTEDDKDETVSNDNDANADKVESFAVGADRVEVDSESSSDLSDYELSVDVVEVERPWVPPPQLPPSSGNLGVPEEDVSHLLSVYSFLRSFSVCLFLSPFGLDEFVGALNSSVHNTLLDAIHVSLIRALKSHVETLSSEGSELASKCLRLMDWSLLDSLTWPVLTVQCLTTMRYTEGQEWKEFYVNVWEKDYYTLSAGRKLAILQLLCDNASNSAEIRTDIDNREETEIDPDSDGVVTVSIDESIPKKGRTSKNSLSKDVVALFYYFVFIHSFMLYYINVRNPSNGRVLN
ncbi:LOW QUALITY PROTEIN: ATP-binding protein Uup, partial [Helianthus annuus]|uniref:LOW QUALITY PROTEIN: ATP-binding protein Uup n=1 Tax=Helianthus annuus TaxID=4232 RepID=UPI001652EF91